MLFDLLFDLCNCAYVRNNKRGGLKNLSLNNVVRRGFCGCHITFHPNSTFCLLFRLSIHVFVIVFVFTMLCCEQEQDFSRSYAACTMKSILTCFFFLLFSSFFFVFLRTILAVGFFSLADTDSFHGTEISTIKQITNI